MADYNYDETNRQYDPKMRYTEQDPFEHPAHYTNGFGIEPLDSIIANEMDFLEGNVIKYVSRYPHKGGVNDLKKAKVYIERLIKREEGKK